jgi:type II secretory pathway component GspD/PulD (secretin)
MISQIAPCRRSLCSVLFIASFLAAAGNSPRNLCAQSPTLDAKPADGAHPAQSVQTFFLTNITEVSAANGLQTALRNMNPRAKVFYESSQNAIVVNGTADDLQLAQKLIADFDRPRKAYRVTYTITETDGHTALGARKVVLLVSSGSKTVLKQGSRVPIVTGRDKSDDPNESSQMQYMDVGLNIETTINGNAGVMQLHGKIEESSVADEKTVAVQDPKLDPTFRQTVLQGDVMLVPGKPATLGALDMPGTSHREEIEVVCELVH